jgi:hypothetical protein
MFRFFIMGSLETAALFRALLRMGTECRKTCENHWKGLILFVASGLHNCEGLNDSRFNQCRRGDRFEKQYQASEQIRGSWRTDFV